jgi:archaellum component FlaC
MGVFKDWWPFAAMLLTQIVGMAVMWTRLVDKVNGQGERITLNASRIDTTDGKLGRMEREMSEYRHDAQMAASGLARLEKGVEGVNETVNQGNLAIGSQLHAMERLITDKDVRTQVRLTRIETVVKVEEKIGPIPVEP